MSAAEWEQATAWRFVTFQQKGSSRALSGKCMKKKSHVGGWIGAQEQEVPCVALQSNHFITLDVGLTVFFFPVFIEDETLCWSVHRFTCGFLDIYALQRPCWTVKGFYSVPSLPSSICFSWLSNKGCLCHSELPFPSRAQAHGGTCVVERTKGACRFLGTSWKELPGFEYFWNSGPLVGAKYSNVWPRIILKIWPRFCHLGVESKHYVCGSQQGRQTTLVRWIRGSRKIRCDGLKSFRHRQPACPWAVLPKPRGWGFWSRNRWLDGVNHMCPHLAM